VNLVRRLLFPLVFMASLLLTPPAPAFCGFFVARADTKLFNKASQVVLVRDEDRTVVTMASDFQGPVTDFAMVVPVPTFIHREQIHVTDAALVDHLDAYTAPRLVEYFDPDPCARMEQRSRSILNRLAPQMSPMPAAPEADALGVRVEASYTVGEYDIQLLSAEQSGGLITWLRQNGYRIPDGAEPVVRSYLARDMRFFVARVNLKEQAKLGFNKLRPLQIAYESDRFMLPIRLGTVNANGDQELFVYTLTRKGRVETTNYRTVKLPTGMDIPAYVKQDFARFYRSLFAHQTERENGRAVFLEYAWDMNWCDPCAADPLSPAQLRELGAFWLNPDPARSRKRDVFVTRLHVRYDAGRFPEDLAFHETGDRTNFQARYVIRHAFQGPPRCDLARHYLERELPRRQQREAANLASITGWDSEEIRAQMDVTAAPAGEPWWKRLWRQ
jgi:hypothetical protein